MGTPITASLQRWWSSIRGVGFEQAHVRKDTSTRQLIAPVPWLCAMTDGGPACRVNEDAFRIGCAGRVWVVADGMGGQKCGAIASRITVDAVIESMDRTYAANPLTTNDLARSLERQLRDALRAAHERVLSKGATDDGCRGLGSAVVAGCVCGDFLYIGHAGDARAYVSRGGSLNRLTTDHSAIALDVVRGMLTWEEARRHRSRSRLHQAAGVNAAFEPAFTSVQLSARDKILLCSDGVWGMLSDAEISEVLGSEMSVLQMTHVLANRALAAGGRDNLTVVLYEHFADCHRVVEGER